VSIVQLLIGTRGSQLALTQTRGVRDLLLEQHPGLEVEIQVIQTRGDVTAGSLRRFGGQGVFTKEIENALLDGRIDLAVHSLKDLPTGFHPDLALVAAPPREDVRDVLITRQGCGLEDLPPGAILGTGSLRRRAQVLALRPDLELREIRGNLDTRINKVFQGEYDGVLLAAAGLHRLGWQDRISAYLDPSQVLPAVAQGARGLQMRRDHDLMPLVEAANHAPTLAAVAAERSLLRCLQGGCHAPVAAWGQVEGNELRLDGMVGRPDGSLLLRAAASGSLNAAEALGAQLGADLCARGADALLAELETARGRDIRSPALIVGEGVDLREPLSRFEGKPLFGRRVLITRSREQAGPLQSLLEDAGARVSLLPLLDIQPPDDWSALDRCLERLDAFAWVVFASPNSVDFFFARLRHLGQDTRAFGRAAVAAVGQTTAEHLRDQGIHPNLVPADPSQEGLVAAFLDVPVEGREILIPASAIGRTLLAEKLQERGARVHRVTAYQNLPPDPAQVALPPDLTEGRLDLVVFASPSSVKHFGAVLGEASARELLTKVRIACIGPTTARAVEELGLEVHIQPDESSIPALVQAICACYAESRP